MNDGVESRRGCASSGVPPLSVVQGGTNRGGLSVAVPASSRHVKVKVRESGRPARGTHCSTRPKRCQLAMPGCWRPACTSPFVLGPSSSPQICTAGGDRRGRNGAGGIGLAGAPPRVAVDSCASRRHCGSYVGRASWRRTSIRVAGLSRLPVPASPATGHLKAAGLRY